MYKITVVANYFLSNESMTQKKLQKLCYYAQAHYIAIHDEKLINTDFEAWVHGPVSSELYHQYKKYGWKSIPLENSEYYFPKKINNFLNQVYRRYKKFDANQLENLTHQEEPWKEARIGLSDCESSCNIISNETMKTFYSSDYFSIS